MRTFTPCPGPRQRFAIDHPAADGSLAATEPAPYRRSGRKRRLRDRMTARRTLGVLFGVGIAGAVTLLMVVMLYWLGGGGGRTLL